MRYLIIAALLLVACSRNQQPCENVVLEFEDTIKREYILYFDDSVDHYIIKPVDDE